MDSLLADSFFVKELRKSKAGYVGSGKNWQTAEILRADENGPQNDSANGGSGLID
jgi:hypothetical protein